MREQYADFYKDKERWRYLKKLDTNHSLLSLEGFTDSEGNVIDFVIDEAVDVAETVVRAVMVDRLKAALPLLSDSEQTLIQAIFFEELSEREVGLQLGVTQSVVNKRKAKILAKPRKRFCVSAALMKQPLSKSAQMTGQILIPTGGFTDGRATLANTLRAWRTGRSRRR